MTTKICTGCGARKSLVEFSNDIRGKNGKTSRCRVCTREKAQAIRGIRARDIRHVQQSPVYTKEDGKNLYGFEREFGGGYLRTGLGPKHEPKPLNKNSGLASQIKPIMCPCCGQQVAAPTLEIVIDAYQLPPQEAQVLRAVWKGKGMPVMPDRIFDLMYEDDPDGGPPPARMYANFQWALTHLRKRLEGTGIQVLSAGYRRGYRLQMGF